MSTEWKAYDFKGRIYVPGNAPVNEVVNIIKGILGGLGGIVRAIFGGEDTPPTDDEVEVEPAPEDPPE